MPNKKEPEFKKGKDHSQSTSKIRTPIQNQIKAMNTENERPPPQKKAKQKETFKQKNPNKI